MNTYTQINISLRRVRNERTSAEAAGAVFGEGEESGEGESVSDLQSQSIAAESLNTLERQNQLKTLAKDEAQVRKVGGAGRQLMQFISSFLFNLNIFFTKKLRFNSSPHD